MDGGFAARDDLKSPLGGPPFSEPASPTAYAGELSIEHPQPVAEPAPPPALVMPQLDSSSIGSGGGGSLGLARLSLDDGVDDGGIGAAYDDASSDGNRSRSSSNAALIDDGQGFLEGNNPQSAAGGGENAGSSTVPEASFNFINSIVGAGLIGIPFALKEAGLGLGIVLLIVMGYITDYSISLLVRTGLENGKSNYGDLVSHVLGRKGYFVLIFAQFFFPICGMIAYTMIVGQTYTIVFDRLLGHTFLSEPTPVKIIMTLTVMLPLSLNKRLESLAKWSLVAMAGVVVVGIVVIVRGVSVDKPWNRGNAGNFAGTRFIQSIGVMAFAYVCHHNTFLIYASLKDASVEKFAKVTHISIGTALIMMVVIGIGGYLPFGDATCANVLENFSEEDDAINVARFFYGITIMLTYPIECFVAREVLEDSFSMFAGHGKTRELHHNLLTIGISLTVMIIAIILNDLGLVFELNGVFNATLLAFVLPGLCGVMSGYDSISQVFAGGSLERSRWGALGLSIFGIAVVVLGLGLIIAEVAGKPKESQCQLAPPNATNVTRYEL